MSQGEKINIAIAGGPCTGKSTLAAYLFASQKMKDYDYDLITSESRKVRAVMGKYRNPFKFFYLWRLQDKAETSSIAKDGFITDTPLFNRYGTAQVFARSNRDKLAVGELFKMCLEVEDRYQLIVMAKNPFEFNYSRDSTRIMSRREAAWQHRLIRDFVEDHWPRKVLYVEGTLEQRLEQVEKKLDELRIESSSKHPQYKKRASAH